LIMSRKEILYIVLFFIGGFQGSAPREPQGQEADLDPSVGILRNLTASQIGPTYSMENTASLDILGPHIYNIKEGNELALICRNEDRGVVGTLRWRKKDGVMPNGQSYILGGQVIIERLGRYDGGEYQCWDNSSGVQIFRSKIVNVQYPPSVSVHKLYLSQHNSLTLELVCSVQSNPITEPKWVRLNPKKAVLNVSTEWSLKTWVVERQIGREQMSVVVIHSPQDQHLGEYACEAANSLGKDSKIIQIEGFDSQLVGPLQFSFAPSFHISTVTVCCLIGIGWLTKIVSKICFI